MQFESTKDNPFARTLQEHGLDLVRDRCHTLQVNVGLKCDLACRHCHLSAGPTRREIMSRQIMEEVIDFAGRASFQVADITGGAPELVPNLDFLLAGLVPVVPRIMLRSNLTALGEYRREGLIDLCRRLKVAIVASLPAVSPSQVEALRGTGVWDKSVAVLQRLNELGYGRPGSGLELHLVANPAGAFLPQGQAAAERQFKRALAEKLGISFNHLYVFANMPLGRFRQWLESTGNLDAYMTTLARAFNPCTVEGLMCRSLVSVAWDGTLYDCDFNQGAGLTMGERRIHIRDLDGPPPPDAAIATGEHCYACTAGSGFT
jgi:radical SAM/Cys-rich protein